MDYKRSMHQATTSRMGSSASIMSTQEKFGGLQRKACILPVPRRAHFDSADYYMQREGKLAVDDLPIIVDVAQLLPILLPMKLTRSELPTYACKPSRLSQAA